MIFDKRITSITGKFDSESPEYTITYKILSDNWRDGPLAIQMQGVAKSIVDASGRVQGWLKQGEPWIFGNENDRRVKASAVEVSDRKVIDSDEEYEIYIRNGGIQFSRSEHRIVVAQWTVKQSFKKESPENEEPDDDPSIDDAFQLRTSKEYYDVAFTRDMRTGKPVTNSAGDPFRPALSRRKVIRVFSLTRKERPNNLKLYEQYEDIVNKDEWYGAQPGTILMESIIPDWDGSIFTVTYNFKYKADGWGEKYLDTGMRYVRTKETKYPVYDHVTGLLTWKTKSIKEYFPILTDGTQTTAEEPEKLDGTGHVPIRRKDRQEAFVDFDGFPMKDSDTGEILYRETGDPILDEKGNEILYKNFPGIDLPFDPPDTPAKDRHYFWKYKELDLEPLRIPNPYKVKAKDKPTVTEEPLA